MIITIDGPAGSGKSTAARKLAARLNVPYLDTGAMYRAIGLEILEQDVALTDAPAMLRVAKTIDLTLDCGPTFTRVAIDGRDVSEAIRTMPVSKAAAAVAVVQPIRALLVERQRALGESLGSLVSEGRDQGSVVFPDADVKFVIEASPERRAQRRLDELHADGEEITFEEVLDHVKQRDANDAVQWAPLLAPGAAVRLDTTHLTIAEVVDRLETIVRQRARSRVPPVPTP